MLLLQEFEFEIQHRSGTQHAVADYLSRIENGEEAVEGYDNFLDTGILRISAKEAEEGIHSPDKWLEEMTYFLSTRLLHPRLRTDEKKCLAFRS